jgi:uncharacterized membrane protein YqaE (UPF0057 family)
MKSAPPGGRIIVESLVPTPEGRPVLYLVAILFPPLAVLCCGRPFQSVLNFFLTLFFWIPGMVHALAVVADHHADRRNERLIAAMAGHRYR